MKKTILISAGPTREHLDPVRYISNMSSGRMGYLIAEEGVRRGHRVILVSGPTSLSEPDGVEFVPVVSALDMQRELERFFSESDCLFMSAAVCDYRPATSSDKKIKNKNDMQIDMICNPDILKGLSAKKKDQFVCGFCIETNDLIKHAEEKLRSKGLDMIVASQYSTDKNPFGANKMEPLLIFANGDKRRVEPLEKKELAASLLDFV